MLPLSPFGKGGKGGFPGASYVSQPHKFTGEYSTPSPLFPVGENTEEISQVCTKDTHVSTRVFAYDFPKKKPLSGVKKKNVLLRATKHIGCKGEKRFLRSIGIRCCLYVLEEKREGILPSSMVLSIDRWMKKERGGIICAHSLLQESLSWRNVIF